MPTHYCFTKTADVSYNTLPTGVKLYILFDVTCAASYVMTREGVGKCNRFSNLRNVSTQKKRPHICSNLHC